MVFYYRISLIILSTLTYYTSAIASLLALATILVRICTSLKCYLCYFHKFFPTTVVRICTSLKLINRFSFIKTATTLVRICTSLKRNTCVRRVRNSTTLVRICTNWQSLTSKITNKKSLNAQCAKG